MDHTDSDRIDADATVRDRGDADVTGRDPDARDGVGTAGDVTHESGAERRNDLADDDEEARRRTDHATAGEDGRDPGYAGDPAARSPRHDDEYAAAVPGAVTPAHGIPATAVEADVLEDPAYRDPYARTDGDLPAEPGDARPAGEAAPAHAAPDEIFLFDQDPTEVQARWRDVQASFVDDPGEAVQRADGLVEEVVESLTSTLTSRTDALRGRWKDAGSADTEELRQAFREYRSVLERLLALSSKSPSQYQSQETR
ncbi:hypothetical protein E1286_45960 [Nonomuraea terrae]|uniref:Uncharacterized protein n=1 Tax=Nonomuraea terrae TaxID=2530383 RepID=A0A4R4XHR7_9ACTN|nr:hypothetical protein [Nonomuraea terrae]TDD30386.1 hypothetical protein E1286_45960 [Nonomuraea terrae]